MGGWLHSGAMHDVIAWDEANYVFAAKEGLIANAIEMGELSTLRHEHAPLTCYSIALSTALFGDEEWAIRLPAVLISALSCGLLVLIVHDLARGFLERWRLGAGVAGGLFLATSPASIELAGVIQPHSFVVFFMLLNLWALCRYLRDLQRRDAVLFGLSLAGQFVTMEYGPIILFFALLAVALVRPTLLFGERPWAGARGPAGIIKRALYAVTRSPWTMHRDLKIAAAACIVTSAAIWPAGVIFLGIARNFAYYLLYAAHGHPILFRGEVHLHVPRYAYAYWYWIDYPLLLIAILVMLLLIVLAAWRQRGPVAVTLAVFAMGLAASVHASHIMQLCKSIFMIPPLAVGGPLAALWAMSRVEYPSRSARWNASISRSHMDTQPALRLVFMALLAFMAILGGRTAPMSRDSDPNQRLVEMARIIAAQAGPGDRVLAQGWPMVRYLLHLKCNRPDIVVHQYDPRNLLIDRLGERLASNEFNWAVTIGPMAAANKDCPVLAELRARWLIAADQSLPGREYRVYRHEESLEEFSQRSAAYVNENEEVKP